MSRTKNPKKPREDYFFAYVQIHDCWDWTGYRTPDNYGRFWDGQRMVMAHRWVYEHLTQTIIGELTIDHVCKNTLCVNPDHMERVTDEVNRARGGARFASRIAQQRRTHCLRGHEFTPENTIIHGINERVCRPCVNMKQLERYYRDKGTKPKQVRKKRVLPPTPQSHRAILTEEQANLQAVCDWLTTMEVEAYNNVVCAA